MNQALRVVLPAEESERVRTMLKNRKLKLRDQLWDHAPLILLTVMITQLMLLALGGAYVWQNWASKKQNLQASKTIALNQNAANVSSISVATPVPAALAERFKSPELISPVEFSALKSARPSVLFGIRVSARQGQINWSRLKAAGVAFVSIKATEGSDIVDPQFKRNWQSAADARIARSAYHVYTSKASAQDQAKHYTRTLSAVSATGDAELPAVLELESAMSKGEDIYRAKDELFKWLRLVRQDTGMKPLIYGSLSLFDGYLKGSALKTYPIWLTEYSKGPTQYPQGWPRWAFWQLTEKGKIDGVQGELEFSQFSGSEASFERIVRKQK
ncbi:glycoside hydrolase family 25 protein [Undibacterium sp. Rencai35W]|uniref:glycoside hydrolase family 25 protein n=1 Tax=Undibacterium sp. Rencai35W TaxID=3413046 RepID=UPI003BF3BD57